MPVQAESGNNACCARQGLDIEENLANLASTHALFDDNLAGGGDFVTQQALVQCYVMVTCNPPRHAVGAHNT